MKELFRDRDIMKVYFYRSLLEDAGIFTFVRNENLSAAEGVWIPDFFPALCVLNEGDYESARELIRNDQRHAEDTSVTEAVCETCGEMIPDSFDSCWNCQSPVADHPSRK